MAFPRQWLPACDPASSDICPPLTIVTWNVLADGLATDFAHLLPDAPSVAWPHRLSLILKELAALDAEARVEARARLADRLRTLACPVLLVTHDPEDVRVLATRVVLLAQGRLETAAAERGQGAGAS